MHGIGKQRHLLAAVHWGVRIEPLVIRRVKLLSWHSSCVAGTGSGVTIIASAFPRNRWRNPMSMYAHKINPLTGSGDVLGAQLGKVTLLVNVASKCGLTPQYTAMQQLQIDLVVADLSFISLKLVLPALFSVASEAANFLVMVKPQFEVGKDKLGAGGVVRDAQLRKEAVAAVAASAYEQGFGCLGVVASPLPGPSGNVEYFLWLQKGAPALRQVDLDLAIETGPA